jgi:hypothetical protein
VTRLLLRAAAWPALLALAAAGAAAGIGGVLLGRTGTGLLMVQLSLVLVGGAAACALDEPAAAVVDACPVRRARRVLVRAVAGSVPLVTGAGVVASWWLRTSPHRLVLLQLLGCWLLGFALAVVAGLRLDEPAEVVAPGLMLFLVTLLLVEPAGRTVALFSDGARTAETWLLLAGAAVLAVLSAVRERRWR